MPLADPILSSPQIGRTLTRVALRTALVYWMIAVLWILFSDKALDMMVSDPGTVSRIQTFKGWAFVSFSALFIFLSLHAQFRLLEKASVQRDEAISAQAESEERLRLALNASNMGVWEWDLHSDEFIRSKEFEEIIGFPRDGGAKVFNEKFLHPEDREKNDNAVKAAVADALKGDGTGEYSVEYRIIRPDGAIRWIYSRAKIRTEGTGIRRMIGLVMDITERKQAEERLRSSEELFRVVAGSAPVGIFRTDPNGRGTYHNLRWCELAGLTQEQCLGDGWAGALHPDDRERVYKEWQRSIAEDIEFKCEYRFKTPQGKVNWVHGVAVAVRDAGGQVESYVGSVMDVTERRQLEEQLRQSQKMDAVGQIAGGVAHDFNNLLTVINGYTETLLTRHIPGDPGRHELEQVLNAGERAAALTRQLLTFSRQSFAESRVVNLNEIVKSSEAMLHRVIGENIELTASYASDLANLKAAPDQIGQILLNLAVNARDAMPRGGKLRIVTTNEALDESFIRLHTEARPGRYVLLAVSDTGSGMAPEVRARIFEPFFTTKEHGKGTGLGLAVVHGIVKQSGGFIDVYSEPEMGSVFKIYFPVTADPVRDALSQAAPKKQAVCTESILLVEDESAVRDIAMLVLKSSGYRVRVAGSGKEALKIAAENGTTYDLLLTDVVMPGMSGNELAMKLQEKLPQLKVLYMSGYTSDEVMRQGIKEGEIELLQKPFTPAVLTARVRKILDRP